jgi:1-acyl-sn-glycerol-3-phosphate acyltransferase
VTTIVIRSVLFNILFYANLALHLAATVPGMLLPRHFILGVAKSWGRSSNWLLRVVADVRTEITGLEKLPKGPLLVASKHQSIWETFTLPSLFDDPAFIVKRELMWLPFFGWSMWWAGMVPVNRGAGSQALIDMSKRAGEAMRAGRQLIIFPEGTRRAPGAEPRYKYGVAHLYAESGVPCVPIALNSGMFWGRRAFLRYPGTIRMQILDPIPPGLDKQVFFERLRDDIESATAKLIAQAAREGARPIEAAQT